MGKDIRIRADDEIYRRFHEMKAQVDPSMSHAEFVGHLYEYFENGGGSYDALERAARGESSVGFRGPD